MVEIRRKNKVKETFHIADNDGRELTVECVLDPGEALPAFNRARNSIIRAQTTKQPDFEAMGRAILDVFAVFFGEEGAMKILDFYGGNYTDMMEDVFPYINTILLPKLEAESAKRREAMKDLHRNRPFRRLL